MIHLRGSAFGYRCQPSMLCFLAFLLLGSLSLSLSDIRNILYILLNRVGCFSVCVCAHPTTPSPEPVCVPTDSHCSGLQLLLALSLRVAVGMVLLFPCWFIWRISETCCWLNTCALRLHIITDPSVKLRGGTEVAQTGVCYQRQHYKLISCIMLMPNMSTDGSVWFMASQLW